MQNIHIWIDADSCPLKVRNHCVKIAAKYNFPVSFVANKEVKPTLPFPFESIVCEQTKDSADNFIFENACENDLVITKDIVFADRLVEKNISCINDRGKEFTKENIKSLLSDRDFDLQLANCGLVKHYHEGYDDKKFEAFANCFDRVLNKIIAHPEKQPE